MESHQKKPPTNKNQMMNSSSSSPSAAAGTQKTGSTTAPKPPPDNQPPLKCPRCDSPNTKFCYYNNYSLTQPRHFCKTCRRYWTRGGALRNVPIGGGCRKNKKTKSSSTSFSFSTSCDKPDYADTSSDGFKLFYGGFSPSLDQLDQFGRIPFSRLSTTSSSAINNPTNSLFSNHHQQLVSFGDLSSNTSTTTTATTSIPSAGTSFHIDNAVSSGGNSLMGFSYPAHQHAGSSIFKQEEAANGMELFNGGGGVDQDLGSGGGGNNNLASSMECLSSINQELHWKLQQQRLAMLFGGGGGGAVGSDHDENINNNNLQMHKDQVISSTTNNNSASVSSVSGELLFENLQQEPKPLLPISFQNLEISKQEAAAVSDHHPRKGTGVICGGNEWFFADNSSSYTPILATSTNNNSSSSWKGIQAWSDMQNYSHHHHDLQN